MEDWKHEEPRGEWGREERRWGEHLSALYALKLKSISDYWSYILLAEEHAPAVADLFRGIAEEEMEHYRDLGRFLVKLGKSPVPRTVLRGMPFRLYADAESHGPILAEQLLEAAAGEEHRAAKRYRNTAAAVKQEQLKKWLLATADAAEEHETLERKLLARMKKS